MNVDIDIIGGWMDGRIHEERPVTISTAPPFRTQSTSATWPPAYLPTYLPNKQIGRSIRELRMREIG